MREQRYGIEIELTGLTRQRAAEVAAEYFGSRSNDSRHYSRDAYNVPDSQGRTWRFVSDASISAQRKEGRNIVSAGSEYKVELVSPICTYDDIPTIQELARRLRGAGAIANSSCGVHIHVDAAAYEAVHMKNLINIMASKEDLIYKALQVEVEREYYCKKADPRFVDEINRTRPRSRAHLMNIWDGGGRTPGQERYRCLNLASIHEHGTVEFRLFNGTTHAGKIKSYIQLCLAISHQALSQKSASRIKTASSNEKYTFRTWLLRLGLIGDEFKTARLHLLEHLDGSIAWKDPQQAERQKERLRAQRELERLQTQSPASVAAVEQESAAPLSPETGEMEMADDEQDFNMSMSM
jgi:hypothetical protein